MASNFAKRLLDWWTISGRHDLPWQIERTPYRVWVSEIMLQQTQVTTVIGYFQKFMARFPTLRALSQAELDDVLALWSGLGYYARARNLHQAAQRCVESHGGQLPQDPESLQALPGIGRSTANAIVAQAYNQRAVILDGNVKRVLARHGAIQGWPGHARIENALWALAEEKTPTDRAADYTQAIMDLGATVCRRTQPRCDQCPVASDCQARAQQLTHRLPTPRPTKPKPVVDMPLAILINSAQAVWLEKRPARGIWGGLWCLPPMERREHFTCVGQGPVIASTTHLLTHRALALSFVSDRVDDAQVDLSAFNGRWHGLSEALDLGLPQPIKHALFELHQALS